MKDSIAMWHGVNEKMVTCQLKICLCITAISALLAGAEPAEHEQRRVIIPMTGRRETALRLRMPPLAKMKEVSESGDTWRQTGEMAASYRATLQDLRKCLRQQQWRLLQEVKLDAVNGRRRDLMTWRNDGNRILVMVSEISAGRTAIAWGIENPAENN